MAVNDPTAAALARLYRDLEMRLTQHLLDATISEWRRERYEALRRQVAAEIAKAEGRAPELEKLLVARNFDAGQEAASEEIAGVSERHGLRFRPIGPDTWDQLNRQSIEALAGDVAGQRTRFLTHGILRQADDYLRQLSSGEVSAGLGLGRGPRAVGRAIRDGSIRQLQDGRAIQYLAGRIESAVGVVYSDGSVHSLQAYGEMSARTGMMRAYSEGSAARHQEYGIHLYRVSTHQTLCWMCRPFEGTVWAYDAQGEAMGYAQCPREVPFHPNCRHHRQAFVPEVMEGENLDPSIAGMDDRALYRHMRDDVPDGAEMMRWQRLGWRNEKEARAGIAAGKEHGPHWRDAGIEGRRNEALKAVLAGGGKTSYSQEMSRITGNRMRAERRGIFKQETGNAGT